MLGDLEGNLTAERQKFRVRLGRSEAHAFYRQAEEKRLRSIEMALENFATLGSELVDQPSNTIRRETLEVGLEQMRQALAMHGQGIRDQEVWPGTSA